MPDLSPSERAERARIMLDALSALIGSTQDLHTVPSGGLAMLLDLLCAMLAEPEQPRARRAA